MRQRAPGQGRPGGTTWAETIIAEDSERRGTYVGENRDIARPSSTHAIGLVIDGEVLRGESGTYPVLIRFAPKRWCSRRPWRRPASSTRRSLRRGAAQPAWAARQPHRARRARVQGRRGGRGGSAGIRRSRPANARARKGALGGAVRLGNDRRDGRRIRAARGRGSRRTRAAGRRRSIHLGGSGPPRGGGVPVAVQLARVGPRQQGAPCSSDRQHRRREGASDLPGRRVGRGGGLGRGPARRGRERPERPGP